MPAPAKIRSIYTKVAGVTHDNGDGTSRQEIIARCREGEHLLLARDPANLYDTNAVEVRRENGEQLGYLSADWAEEIGPRIDRGWVYVVRLKNITGGGDHDHGVNITLTFGRPGTDLAAVEAAVSAPTEPILAESVTTAAKSSGRFGWVAALIGLGMAGALAFMLYR